jgi:ribonucleoside-diphosphate reductase alpha chain
MSNYKSNLNPMFRSKFSEDIFNHKYRHEGAETWGALAKTLVEDVCSVAGDQGMPKEDKDQLTTYIRDMKFIPGGRYLYYAGRSNKFFNNCYLLKAEEDTREDWANLSWKAESCLMTGGGIGVDYSVYRAEGEPIQRTGGQASGPIPKMNMINEIGRRVMQGGSRRSAIYASLNWKHGDIHKFLKAKDWADMPVGKTGKSLWDIKQEDFNFPAPLDMTNVSVNYDTEWLMNYWKTGDYGKVFEENVHQALKTAEPGFAFNFFDKEDETLRNACTEVTSADDSDVCNLGSLNFGRIKDIDELKDVVRLATMFLICGTLKADLPYEKVGLTRAKNRRLGLGIMGMHEWLIKKGYRYEVTPELHQWLGVYKGVSDTVSRDFADRLSISRPVANRAIAPTGTIGILAGTSTGIEPIFAVAYKRRYLKGSNRWHYQYVVDSAAQELIDLYGANPDTIESALDLSEDFERRIKFQADVQDYVDMAISSTINLPAGGSKANNEDTVDKFADTLAKYAHRLRGFTCYPDGSRGGQPLTSVPYSEAVEKLGTEFEEHIESHDICDISGTGGSCGI